MHSVYIYFSDSLFLWLTGLCMGERWDDLPVHGLSRQVWLRYYFSTSWMSWYHKHFYICYKEYFHLQGGVFVKWFFCHRFQGQTQLYKSKPIEFRMAIEEAFLAEHGFADLQLEYEVNITERPGHNESVPAGIQEATDSNQEQECRSQSQASYLKSPWCTEIHGTS